MNTKKTLLTAAFAVVALAMQAQPLKQDTAVLCGKMDNGLTYYIRHNAQTPGVADFYIAQRVGSILEEPRQRGLAHFLEHMAFNGTKNFPGAERGGLREWCEQKGIKFGANLNAYTSVDETVYNISAAPVTKEGVTDTCLLILHDWSHFLLLEDEEIDKERGVIHEEWRTRRAGMAVQRMMEEALPVIYKGSKYEDCLPIGSMDIVDHFAYNDLRDYYHKWYRPDLQAIIVVGDINPADIEKRIRSTFADVAAQVDPAERIYYPVPDNDSIIIFTKQDAEQPALLFSLYMKRDITPREERGQESAYRDDFKSAIVTHILRERLKTLTDRADPPLLSATVRDGSFFISSSKDAFAVSAGLKQEQPLAGITAALEMVEQARQHGFTEAELQRAKAERLRVAETRYGQRDKMRNKHYVSQCLAHFTENQPMLSAEESLRLTQKMNESVTLDEVNAAAREMICDRNQVVTLYGPDKDGFLLPSTSQIKQAIAEAQGKQYAPYKEAAIDTRLITTMPKKGKIKKQSASANGYTEYVLSNGMHVFARRTDFDGDRISLNMFSLGGRSRYEDADLASISYIGSTMQESGVASFDATTLKKMLAGNSAAVTPFVGSETEGMQGTSTGKDLETMLQLVYLYFTQPRFDRQAFTSLMDRQASFLTNRNANPNVDYNDSIVAILYGNHPRLKPMKKERLKEVSFERICDIYRERFDNAGDFNVILTGNIDEQQLKPLLCLYLASLPANDSRENVIDRGEDIRPVDETHVFRKKQATPSALTTIYITSPVEYNAKNDLCLSALCQVLRMVYTEKVREEKGGTYGVSVQGSLQRFPREEGLLKINFRTDPDKYDELIPIIYAQLDSMAANGPAPDDLQKVKEYELKSYGQVAVTNGYWDYVKYNELRNNIDFDKDYTLLVEQLTTDDLRNLMRELLAPRHRIQVTMLPE